MSRLLILLTLMCGLTTAASAVELLLSHSAQRAPALPLDGQQVDGEIYVFVDAQADIASVDFSLDGRPLQTEEFPPWDLAGTDDDGNAFAFDTLSLEDGRHSIAATVNLHNGDSIPLHADVLVANEDAQLLVSDTVVFFNTFSEEPVQEEILISESNGAAHPIELDYYADWLVIDTEQDTTPDILTFEVDPSGLAPGLYDAEVYVTAQGYDPVVIEVSLAVGAN
ncbi:Ig-like domain-containing protein [Ferrimonas marina]|uniref:Ig-like domain (Group 3) n=1 Tax=Ferrimonas marina TaxID=299255 RepID=A0A1M5N0W0_9GAMM|nr:Ig-like domain-containing protein [Ferrimonas marina]SHG82623.1 hypothetical protein SAMN02745129_0840 [Ferrimonas marina]